MFKGLYERPFNQLISSHLDIDRCDYLKRDSFLQVFQRETLTVKD